MHFMSFVFTVQLVCNYLMLEHSIDPTIFPEVQGTAQYDLLPEADGQRFNNIKIHIHTERVDMPQIINTEL